MKMRRAGGADFLFSVKLRSHRQAFSSFSLLYLSSSLRNWAFGFITVGLSPRQRGQYHFPLGFVVN